MNQQETKELLTLDGEVHHLSLCYSVDASASPRLAASAGSKGYA
jgi:hypothetical protein